MPANYSTNIVYLSKAQYQELLTNQTITVNGTTVTYNENDIYVTPQAEPITDVKINGTSIGSDGIANIPVANSNQFGLIKVENSTVNQAFSNGGTIVLNDILYTVGAASSKIKQGVDQSALISAAKMAEASFYGLSKIAGVDLKNEVVTLGTYPDSSKAAIQNMLGITGLLSTEESSTATAAHALNSTFMMDGKLHRATAAIAIGDAVEVGTNCEVVKVDEVFVKNTDYATESKGGIIRTSQTYGTEMNGEQLRICAAPPSHYKAGDGQWRPIVPAYQHQATFYGLSKVAGVDLKNEEITLGTYPETSKTAIRALIGAAAATSIPTATSDLTNDTYYVSASFDNNNGLVLATAASWAEEASF